MTVTLVARHLGLEWKTVKNIYKWYLEGQYSQSNLDALRILVVDEISVKKSHCYLTVVMDYLSGRIVFVSKDRKGKTLKRFFNQMTAAQRKSIETVIMDMWDPYINVVKKMPQAKIVFDLFHVVANFNRLIDKVRNSEYRKASKEDKAVYKGTKYLLLKTVEI
jgi:transposase